MEIQSVQNEKVKKWVKYHQKKYRDIDGCFLVEGEHLIQEALQANQLQTLMIRNGKENIFSFEQDVYFVSDDIIKKVSQNVSLSDYIGICIKKEETISSMQKVILLDDLQDPGNVGTIIRTAYSFGYDAIIIGEGCVDVYNDKTVRSTQGAVFHIPIVHANIPEIISTLQKEGVKVVGTCLEGAKPLSTIAPTNSIGLVFGNEGMGVKKEILASCDALAKIEMQAFESLNVAIAAGICMYYFSDK